MPANIGGMQKVLIDSSTWVSYFAIDCNNEEAKKLFTFLFSQKNSRIAVPEIIYLEVINSLIKLQLPKKEILAFKNLVKKRPKIQLVKTDKKIYRKAAKLAKKVRLKTLDLLILTTALQLKVNKFYTFDKKLKKAYQLTKNLWQKKHQRKSLKN